ncbi:hypothetical protein HNR06_000025 [Nocardiopsis arvandica]|uniref:Uncharacterized protein n=1 Tax=Nocardiopsis sinuspersici TaxID=501010 RepID=A0A7Y9X767_9ACTN|nr:hypothetical protein [Nocardiopsis sinuspersici]NYH50436.1 hypothetical protein [Nocardiopsis sinuspersici]
MPEVDRARVEDDSVEVHTALVHERPLEGHLTSDPTKVDDEPRPFIGEPGFIQVNLPHEGAAQEEEYTKEEFFDALWDRIVDQIER